MGNPVGPVGHEPASVDELAITVNHRQILFRREPDDLDAMAPDDRMVEHDECGDTIPQCFGEHVFDFTRISRL